MVAILCKCGKTYQVDEAFAGRSVRCRRCGETLTVPGRHAAETLPNENHATTGGQPGEFLDQVRYSVVREVAHGGQGKINVARDAALKRDVALKELLDGVAEVPGNQRRFVAEAEITGQLEHPGIVPIYALGADKDGKPFYAMRLVAGQTLKEAIEEYHGGAGVSPAGPQSAPADTNPKRKRGRRSDMPRSRFGLLWGISPAKRTAGGTPAPQAAELKALLRRFVMVCQTMAFAHNRGVIHRDLKPANIMLGGFGETLVMDWGLAKPLRDGESDDSTLGAVAEQQLADRPDLTATDGVVGTPAYMPPEQALGKAKEVGIEADIYSLGAVLYQILTGKPPYYSGSTLEVLKKVATEPPPKPSDVRRHVPRALEAICLKAMARRRTARYRTAAELAESIERWLDDEPVEAYKEPRLERIYRRSRKHKAAVVSTAIALTVALVLGSVATVLIQRERDKATAIQRVADDYLRQKHEAEIKAEQKEAEANRLAKEAEASRREATEAIQQQALARQAADEAKKQIADVQAALDAKSGESAELTQKIEAAKNELTAAETRIGEEAKRADTATDRATELERQVVALRREAEEYRELTLRLARLAEEVAHPRQAPPVDDNAPWSDFADLDPDSFDVVANDNTAGTAVADTEREHTGRQALRVSTTNGGGVCVTYPKNRNANWDLSPYDYVNFAFSLGDADVRYRENGLSVRIGRGSQSIEYRAKKPEEALSLVPKGWAYVRIPLWGDSTWEKREVNPLSLTHVDWIELHISTWSPKLTVWLDDIRFGDSRHLDPPLLPDPDRAAAEYIVATNGEADAWVSGKTVKIRTVADIPSEPFKIARISYLHGSRDVTDAGLKVFGTLPDCHDLSLDNARITDEGLAPLKEMIALESLSLAHCERLTGSGLQYVANHPKLSAIWMYHTPALNDDAMTKVAAIPKLAIFAIPSSNVTDEGLRRLSAHPVLVNIDLRCQRVSEEGLRHLRDLPAGLHELSLLASSMPHGIGMLRGCPIRAINVEGEHISDVFLESLRDFPELSRVGLYLAQIDESTLAHLSKLESLTSLNLDACAHLTERALKRLTEVPKLDSLAIKNCAINDAALQQLTALTKLMSLDLRSVKAAPASVMKRQAALPNCKITVDPQIQEAIDALRAKK